MPNQLHCLEFQIHISDTDQWESLIRFILDEGITKVVAHGDAGTQAGVAAVLNDVYEESLYLPEDGRRFFNAVAAWQEGTRNARVISLQLPAEQALDITSLRAATDETPMELLGQAAQQPAPVTHSGSPSRP